MERLIKFDLWTSRGTIVNLGGSKFQSNMAHEELFDWNGVEVRRLNLDSY